MQKKEICYLCNFVMNVSLTILVKDTNSAIFSRKKKQKKRHWWALNHRPHDLKSSVDPMS